MINPNELRVGNYVLYNNEPVMVKGVTANAVMLDGVMYDTGNPNYPFDYKHIYAGEDCVRPILLCDTMLQKIRSRIPTKGGYAYTYYTSKATFLIYPDTDGYFIGMDFRGNIIHVTPHKMNYLHELQNVYFAQYGSEMDIDNRILARAVVSCIGNGEF